MKTEIINLDENIKYGDLLKGERIDSVKVNKGMSGKYSFEVKLYFDVESDVNLEVVDKLECAIQKLQDKLNLNKE